MKKYIRTKDGIYELNLLDYESPMCLDGKTITTCVYTKNQEWVAKSDILGQSDDLKELCDFIAIVSEKQIYDVKLDIGAYFKYEYNLFLSKAKAEYPEEHWFMYLGILTNKGLIFVAKMNEKGEMELI